MAKGDGFAVCTMKKQTGAAGGLSAHIDREVWDEENQCMVPFRPASVRDDARTALNRECIESAQKIGRTQAIWNRLRDAGFSRKNDDKQDDGKKTRKIKQDAVIALCFVCTSDEETMKKLEAEGKLDEWIEATLDWFRKEFGAENVVSAVLHMDETTPHLHVTVVPITTEEAKVRKEKPKFDENGKPIRKYETDKDGNIILDAKGRATPVKRSYKKKEVTARLSAKDIANPVSMDRWQEEYPKAVAKFGLKRGEKRSPMKNKAPAEYNLEQIQKETEVAITERDAVIEQRKEEEKKRDDVAKQTANIIKEGTEKKEQLDNEVSSLMQTVETKSGELEKVESAIEQKSSVLQNMRNEESRLDDSIAEKKQEQERLNNSTWLDAMKGLVNKSDKDKKYLAEIARLEKENLAVDADDKPVLYKSGNQASWPRYADFLRKEIMRVREEGEESIKKAVEEERKKNQTHVNSLNQTISSLRGSLDEKDKLIKKMKEEKEALLKRIKAIKDAIFETFGPKFKAAVKAIMERANDSNLWRFTRDQKKDVETSLYTQKTVEERKDLGKEAITYAKILLEDNSEWTVIPKEVDEIAENKWEENQRIYELLSKAADAVVSLSKTAGKKNFDSTEQAALNAYLETGGSVKDIWEAPKDNVGNWGDYAKRTLDAYGRGESMKTGLHVGG